MPGDFDKNDPSLHFQLPASGVPDSLSSMEESTLTLQLYSPPTSSASPSPDNVDNNKASEHTALSWLPPPPYDREWLQSYFRQNVTAEQAAEFATSRDHYRKPLDIAWNRVFTAEDRTVDHQQEGTGKKTPEWLLRFWRAERRRLRLLRM